MLPRVFTRQELEVLDDLTANNSAVLASLGGAPTLPENASPDSYGVEKRYHEKEHGVERQRAGSIHR